MTSAPYNLQDVIIRCEFKLQNLEWLEVKRSPDRHQCLLRNGRLMLWAIAVIERDGFDQDKIRSILNNTSPDKQWWMVRSFLSESAFHALERHLDQLIAENAERLAA